MQKKLFICYSAMLMSIQNASWSSYSDYQYELVAPMARLTTNHTASQLLTILIEDDCFIGMQGTTRKPLLSNQDLNTVVLNTQKITLRNTTSMNISEPDKTYKINYILGLISGLRQVQELNIENSLLDQTSINYISSIIGLQRLIFEQDTKINCADYSMLANLVNLEELNLANTSFAESTNENHVGMRRNTLKSFLIALNSLKKLQILNLAENGLFPPVKINKKTSKKATEEKEAYNNWRKGVIEEEAGLLADNFHGRDLNLTDTRLGPVFIDAYGEALISRTNGETLPSEINLSNNYISLDAAVNFILKLRKERAAIKLNFSDNGYPELKKSNRYSTDKLKMRVLEELLRDVEIEG